MKGGSPYKSYVRVIALHELDGRTVPIKFQLEDGGTVLVDKVLDARQAASTKAGGQGMRYTCRIACETGDGGVRSREIYLFCDRDRWFVEAEAFRSESNRV